MPRGDRRLWSSTETGAIFYACEEEEEEAEKTEEEAEIVKLISFFTRLIAQRES